MKSIKTIVTIFVAGIFLSLLLTAFAFAERKTIRISFIDEPRERLLQELTPEFEKETGIKVKIDFYGFEMLYQKNLANCYGHTGEYDIMQLHYPDMGLFDARGWCFDLTDWVQRDADEVQPDDIHPYQKQSHCLFKGRWYGMPMHCNANCFVFRKDILAKLGFTAPTEWEEVLQCAKKVNETYAPDMYGIVFEGRRDIQIAIKSLGMIVSYGNYIYDEKTYRPLIDTEAGLKMFELWKNLTKYAPPGVGSYGLNENYNCFAQGKAAMNFSWTTAPVFYDDPKNSVIMGKYDMTFMPGGATALGGWSLQINNDSLNKEAAWEYIKWATSPAMEKKLAPCMESPRLSVLTDPEVQRTQMNNRVYYQVLQRKPVMLPKIESTYELLDYLSAAANSVVTELLTPREAQKKLQDQYLKIMAAYGLYTGK